MNTSTRPNSFSEEQRYLLAGYVLGDLSPEEMAQVEQWVLTDPQMLKELHALQTSLEVIPQGLNQVSPPAHLRGRIVGNQPAVAKQSVTQRATGRIWQVLVGVGAIAAIILGTDNLRLRQQLTQATQPDRVAAILQQPTSRLIALTSNDSDAAGTLLFTPGNWQEVIVSLGDLPPLPPEEIYHMWLALENGTVIYCGEFNTDADGSVFVRFTPTESPPKGVKATELFVTVDSSQTDPNPSGNRVMTGPI